ncbi:MAG: hypothetical protein IT487_11275 [Chromatiaceae bacterium]|nr:hypothetical protein [Chromatiaceae bacterium]
MPPTDDPIPSQPATDTPAPDLTNPERRAALAKLGRLAAWTAPTLLTLVVSPRESAASCIGGGLDPPCDP